RGESRAKVWVWIVDDGAHRSVDLSKVRMALAGLHLSGLAFGAVDEILYSGFGDAQRTLLCSPRPVRRRASHPSKSPPEGCAFATGKALYQTPAFLISRRALASSRRE